MWHRWNLCYQLRNILTFTELLVRYTSPDDEKTQNEVLAEVSDYCGKPVTNYTLDEYPDDYVWTYFHAFYYALTTRSTVGKYSSSTSGEKHFVYWIHRSFGRIWQHFSKRNHIWTNNGNILFNDRSTITYFPVCVHWQLVPQICELLNGATFREKKTFTIKLI